MTLQKVRRTAGLHGRHKRRPVAQSKAKPEAPSVFPYVVRRAAPTVRHRIPLDRGEGVRSVERRFQRLADEWSAELCLVLTERRAIYFSPGQPPSESDQLPPSGRWKEPSA